MAGRHPRHDRAAGGLAAHRGVFCGGKNTSVAAPTAIISQLPRRRLRASTGPTSDHHCASAALGAGCGATPSPSSWRCRLRADPAGREGPAQAGRGHLLPARSSPSGRCCRSVFDGTTPKIILAALSVFFTTLIGAIVGLRSADQHLARPGPGLRRQSLHPAAQGAHASPASRACSPPCASPPRPPCSAPSSASTWAATPASACSMINSQQALQIERTWAHRPHRHRPGRHRLRPHRPGRPLAHPLGPEEHPMTAIGLTSAAPTRPRRSPGRHRAAHRRPARRPGGRPRPPQHAQRRHRRRRGPRRLAAADQAARLQPVHLPRPGDVWTYMFTAPEAAAEPPGAVRGGQASPSSTPASASSPAPSPR